MPSGLSRYCRGSHLQGLRLQATAADDDVRRPRAKRDIDLDLDAVRASIDSAAHHAVAESGNKIDPAERLGRVVDVRLLVPAVNDLGVLVPLRSPDAPRALHGDPVDQRIVD